MSTHNRTFVALVGLGFDTATAERLVTQRLSVNKLKRKTEAELRALGLTDNQVDLVLKQPRPPLPDDIVGKLLLESRFRCCICREADRSLTIHHIIPRSTSQDDSEQNLVVLCLNDHGEAHTTRELGRNLTPELLRQAKKKWLDLGTAEARDAYFGLTQVEGAVYDYFNHTRLYGIADVAGVDPAQSPSFARLYETGIVDSSGYLNDIEAWRVVDVNARYMYDFGNNYILYKHMRWMTEKVLSQVSLVNVTSSWTKQEVRALLSPGEFAVVQGAFYFKDHSRGSAGRGQCRTVTRTANGVRLEMEIDAWECTSSSSHNSHLSQHKVATAVFLVRSVAPAGRTLVVSATCLTLGSSFKNIRPESDAERLRWIYGKTNDDGEEAETEDWQELNVSGIDDEFDVY